MKKMKLIDDGVMQCITEPHIGRVATLVGVDVAVLKERFIAAHEIADSEIETLVLGELLFIHGKVF